MILAVDPGPVESAYVRLEAGRVAEAAKVPNGEILRIVEGWRHWPLAVEMIASYGMPVGAEVFETCVFIGRIWQAYGREPIRVRRIQVKSHLCHSARANDASVRQALLDRWGGKGTAIGRKAAPGPLYGVHGDAWAALAVAVTVSDGGEVDRVTGSKDYRYTIDGEKLTLAEIIARCPAVNPKVTQKRVERYGWRSMAALQAKPARVMGNATRRRA